MEPDIIDAMGITSHGYRDAAEILSQKLHALFVNKLGVTAPKFIYDIDTLVLYMMDSCPTHLTNFMSNEFSQGYLAGFVSCYIDHIQAEMEQQEDDEEEYVNAYED